MIIIVVVGVGLATYFLFFNNPDQTLRVKYIPGTEGGTVTYKVSDYKDSTLNLYPYGAFDIQLIRTIGDESTLIFSGIGRYTKEKNSYIFTYEESYALVGANIVMHSLSPQTYPIEKNRVRFEHGLVYFFGK